jgi:hypothetical protein
MAEEAMVAAERMAEEEMVAAEMMAVEMVAAEEAVEAAAVVRGRWSRWWRRRWRWRWRQWRRRRGGSAGAESAEGASLEPRPAADGRLDDGLELLVVGRRADQVGTERGDAVVVLVHLQPQELERLLPAQPGGGRRHVGLPGGGRRRAAGATTRLSDAHRGGAPGCAGAA